MNAVVITTINEPLNVLEIINKANGEWLPITIIVGVLVWLIISRKDIVSPLFISLVSAAIIVMILAVALPKLSLAYDIGRTYYQTMPMFAPVFGLTVSAKNRWGRIIVLVFLIFFFLCTSNVVYQLAGEPRGLILNSNGDYYERYFIK